MKNYLRDTSSRLGGISRSAWACLGVVLTRSRACLAVVPLRAGRRRVLFALLAGLGLLSVGQMTAQTFTVLHSLTGYSDGAQPFGGLVLAGNTLYGTAYVGGSSWNGTVFAVNTNG